MVARESDFDLDFSERSGTSENNSMSQGNIQNLTEENMPEVKQPNQMAANLAQGAKSIRKSAEGTNDWMDEIVDTLTSITNDYHKVFEERPELLAEFLPQQTRLLQLVLHLITLRGDVERGQPPRGPVDNAGNGGDDGNMEARLIALEKDMAAVKTDVAVIRSNYATKEDLHKELHLTTWKIIGAIGVLTTAVFFLARYTPDARPAIQQPAQPAQQVQQVQPASTATVPPAAPPVKP